MPWLLLGLAGALEVVWALALKASGGLDLRTPATYLFLGAAALSFWLLAAALRDAPPAADAGPAAGPRRRSAAASPRMRPVA